MSTNLNYKQVANVDRRTWDVEAYEKRAQARQKALEEGHTSTTAGTVMTDASAASSAASTTEKQEFRPALQGAAGPEGSDRAFLKARSTAVLPELEAQVGQSTFVDTVAASSSSGVGGGPNKTDGVTATGVGWYCKVCDCYLKDSMTYLDHINGRKHQRKLGFSMRVQRSTTDDLKAKLQAMQRKKEAATKEDEEEQVIDFATRVKEKDQALLERQEERRRRRKERKQKAREERTGGEEEEVVAAAAATAGNKEDSQETTTAVEGPQTEKGPVEAIEQEEEEEEEETEEPQVDPALAAIMGFSGFS